MSASGHLGTERFDPLLRDINLPLQATHHPLGFCLRITTNSYDVLAAAAESWGTCSQEFECEPIELRIVVQPEGLLAPEPAFRQQGHLLSIVSDRDNFAVCDLQALTGYAFLSEKTAADHAWLRWFFLESMVYSSLEQRYVAAVHAACVAQGETGVLLCGPSGAGKSTLAFACARGGWTYVSDESVHLLLNVNDRTAVGKPHHVRLREDMRHWFPELANYAARARPNGKVSVDVPLSELPQIRTALRCRIGGIVFLDRAAGGPARVETISKAEAVAALLREKPYYGEKVRALHEGAIRHVAEVPTYRMKYDALDEAVSLLCELAQNQR